MTEETKRLILSLNEKTSKIQSEILKLKNENESLKIELENKIIECDESRVKISDMESRYEALKIAKALGNDNDTLKKRINAMVREIDTCIELIEQ